MRGGMKDGGHEWTFEGRRMSGGNGGWRVWVEE